jgi:subtilase family serine protease
MNTITFARRAAALAALTLVACGGGGGGGSQLPQGVLSSPAPSASGNGPCDALAPQATSLAAGDWLAAQQAQVRPLHASALPTVMPLNGAAGNVAPYSPAEFRAAYGFPALPGAWNALTAQQQQDMGAGQTIYIVVAYHEPRTLALMNQAAQQFGLPACTEVAVGAGTPLPLGAPPAQCTFSVVGADAAGNIAPVPGSNAAWSMEEHMDTQLAHAAAPLARIVVVAAQGPDVASMAGAIRLANRMGPGIVSMSFGTDDRSVFNAYDGAFAAAGMSYVAAAGDDGWNNGTTFWPSAVSTVLSVGGTTLQWNGTTRRETTWSGSGGGASSFRAVPSYQQGLTVNAAGCAAPQRRMTPDVALNADVTTGFLVLSTTSGGNTSWYAAGGTSASAPVWAGVLAVGNAQRTAAGRSLLAGSVHDVLYRGLGSDPTLYQGGFLDVTSGANGSCATCNAGGGYDLTTGLGSPRVGSVVQKLAAW